MNGPPARRAAKALALCLLIFNGACISSNRVTRIADGRRIEGRYIDDEAYAAYVNGVVLETEGRLDAARAAYEQALRYDTQSAELWTRLGALRCRGARSNGTAPAPGSAPIHGDPWEAFAQAAEIDPTYEELYTERSHCHLERGELVAAIADAERAVALDPDRTEPVLALVMALERQGRREDASRWLAGLLAREPNSRDAQEAALAFASRTGNVALAAAARRALAELDATKVAPSLADVDAALTAGDLDRARRIAVAIRLSSGALALRAAALGNVPFARAESDLVLGADPSDSDARIAAIAAADLARDGAALSRALSYWPAGTTPISTLGALVMSEVLRRRVGEDAAGVVRAFAGAAEKSDDPLVRAVAARK